MVLSGPAGVHLGFLDNSRGDDPQDEDFLDFALISHRRRNALTLGLNTSYQHRSNDANGSLAIDLYPPHFYDFSSETDQEEDEYDAFVFSIGQFSEDSSEISEGAADNGPDEGCSASAEDSEPQRPPAPGRKRRKRKPNEQQQGAGPKEPEGDRSSGPQTRSRRKVPETPQSCTDGSKDEKRSKKRCGSQQKHASKDRRSDPSKKRSKRDKKRASKTGKQTDKDKEKTNRGLKLLRCRIFPNSNSDKRVAKKTGEGRGQQVSEEGEKRSRKKKRKHTKHSAKQEDRGGKEPVTGSSRKRKRRDETKSNEGQRSGSKGDDPPPGSPKKKKKCGWIISLFKGKTKPATLSDSKNDPASSQKRKR